MSKYINKPSWLVAWLYCLCAHMIFSFVLMIIFNMDKLMTFKFFEAVLITFLTAGVIAIICVLLIQIFAFIFIKINKYTPLKLTIIGLFLGFPIGLSLSGFDVRFSNGTINELKSIRSIFYVCFIYGALLGFVFSKGLYRSRSD